jgi:hypothetical protein
MKDVATGIKIALLIILLTFAYLVAVTFMPMPNTGAEHSKTIVGFLMGTVFSTLINYYWGNSSKGQTPPNTTTETTETISSVSTEKENKDEPPKP